MHFAYKDFIRILYAQLHMLLFDARDLLLSIDTDVLVYMQMIKIILYQIMVLILCRSAFISNVNISNSFLY